MEQNKQLVRRFVEEALNNGDLDACAKYFHADFVEEVPMPGQGPGIPGLRDVLTAFRHGFPDMKWTIEEQIADADKVVTRFNFTGTHKGEFLGVKPSGGRVKTWGIVIDRIENGKIRSTRIIMDTLGLMAQMGAFPAH